MMRVLMFVLSFAAVCSIQAAFAHDAWLEKSGSGLLVAWGHGKKLSPYDPQFVKQPAAYDCNGSPVQLEVEATEDGVSLTSKEKPTVVTIVFDAGYWVKTPDGYKNMTKREAAGKFDVVNAWKVVKFAKTMLRPCGAFAEPTGLKFEIVPEKDPFTMNPGESLPIKVLYEGQPLAGAAVKVGDVGHSKERRKDVLESDQNGRAIVPLPQTGFVRVNASHKFPLTDDPDADLLLTSTNITFGLK